MKGITNEKTNSAEESLLWEMVFYSNGKIKFPILNRSDEPTHKEIDITDLVLPETNWSPPQRIIERQDLREAIIGVVKLHYTRTTLSKSTPNHISAIIITLAKAFEYGWLNGAYKISDWTPKLTKTLIEKLSESGWIGALNLQERLIDYFSKNDIDPNSVLNKNGGISRSLNKLIGTNINATGISRSAPLIKALLTNKELNEHAPKMPLVGMKFSHLRQTIGAINSLTELKDEEYRLKFTPYPNTVSTARRYAGTSGSTKNISPREVGLLLKNSLHWIDNIIPHAITLFDEVARDGQCIYSTRKILNKSKSRQKLESLLGVQIVATHRTGIKAPGITLSKLCQAVFDACFITIGFMTARRAGEIQDKKFGIYYDALSSFNRNLSLYTCDFYIEKYRKDYKKYFVNKSTARAINHLKNLSDIARHIRSTKFLPTGAGIDSKRDKKISQRPQFELIINSSGNPCAPNVTWFEYGKNDVFFRLALPGETNWRLRPHMLRRAYALIFYYRYENSDLLALAYQLDHINPSVTFQYVTEYGDKDQRQPLLQYSNRKATELEDDPSIDMELDEVAREKLEDFIQSVICSEAKANGGLKKLVTRFHLKLMRRLDYSELDSEGRTKVIARSMESHGQKLRPFPHGDCGAPESRATMLGKCFDKEGGFLDRSQASPRTCHKCAYHRVAEGHIESIELQATRIEAEIADLEPSSLRSQMLSHELIEIRRVISTYRESFRGEN